MTFFLISWKEFRGKKVDDKAEVVKIDDADLILAESKIKTMNAQKRLTTSDYRVYNLDELLIQNGLCITQAVEETEDS